MRLCLKLEKIDGRKANNLLFQGASMSVVDEKRRNKVPVANLQLITFVLSSLSFFFLLDLSILERLHQV
jgi:hypothetical protein